MSLMHKFAFAAAVIALVACFTVVAAAHAEVATERAYNEVPMPTSTKSLAEPASATVCTETVNNGVARILGAYSSQVSGNCLNRLVQNVAILDGGAIDPTWTSEFSVVAAYDCRLSGCPCRKSDACTTATVPRTDVSHPYEVATMLAAKDSGGGYVGVAPGANIYSLDVDNACSTAATNWGRAFDKIAALNTDANSGNDIKVVNISERCSNTPYFVSSETGACPAGSDTLHQKFCAMIAPTTTNTFGVLVVASAGNDGADYAGFFPGTWDDVLTVTGMQDNDGFMGGTGTSWSCPGELGVTYADDDYWHGDVRSAAVYESNYAVSSADQAHTIAAPARCIGVNLAPGYGVALDTGTSLSAPAVAGGALLCLAGGQCTSASQTRTKLRTDAANYVTGNPFGMNYGFNGDPTRPVSGKYFGYVVEVDTY